ncbi:dTDP-4-dehydrorhamnose 3,5-epimerase [Bradyrhizobium sp. S3.5.5]|uniref:dTDP-4-dehydrorhamnose 3,5-epimerase n=1 Tax=unclassified Bradyrhizobium TaxID=2631580 RepID=UPI00339835AB
MKIERLRIPDVLLITPLRHSDERGSFSETFRADLLGAYGVDVDFVQDNHVISKNRGVVRGLHYQLAPRAQGKLVRCSRGVILDVAVDVREGSPTFAKHVAVELSGDNWQQIWVPPGFAHGYVTLDDNCEVIYKTTDYYSPGHERGIAWDDPALQIDWHIAPTKATLSDKDRNLPRLGEPARRSNQKL